MIQEKAKFLAPAVALVLVMFLFSGCALKGPYKCYLDSYPGRVLDMETGEPLEGVVIHVTYWAYGASVAGRMGTQVAVREALTDAAGEYLIPAETIMHECFSGRLDGDLQLFKPGYGYIGKSRLSCPGGKREKVPWQEETVCVIEPNAYLIWELPKLKTKKERSDNLDHVHSAFAIPNSEQTKLRNAISEERILLGFPPLSGPKSNEKKNED